MLPLKRALLLGALSLLTCLSLVWFALPHTTARLLLGLNNWSAGLSEKTLNTDIGVVHYLEGGTGDTIVMVHGIYARKEHWVELARHLIDGYHVIAIDLPGFGDNVLRDDEEYLLDRQRDNLAGVLDALGISGAHIAANSMGAYVSVLLAKERPDLFASLAFVGSPLGVPTPEQSDMGRALAQGQRPLVVRSTEDFERRNDWLSPNIPYLPRPILRVWMQEEVANGDKNANIWEVVHMQSQVPKVLDIAPSLTMPSLVIWCTPDRIFHVSGAAPLARALPKGEVAILDDCGHLPMLDKTAQVAQVYLNFLKTSAAQ